MASLSTYIALLAQKKATTQLINTIANHPVYKIDSAWVFDNITKNNFAVVAETADIFENLLQNPATNGVVVSGYLINQNLLKNIAQRCPNTMPIFVHYFKKGA